ncbi:hypothetical protein [uncultured Corynebacterium sp.]|uniref:hypothetical protein n=1 Tax=uncultured Corynebacterium sp. TaxID=159447 RepID=UPI00261F952F|nr:hypothetical protein [uncultured Corynebacterium sp.]
MSGASWAARTALIAWGVFLVGALTWPFLLVFSSPGSALALRDMMVLPHPALTHAALGFGDLPARSAPQDGVLAVVGKVLPATWFVALAMVSAAGVAAWVGARAGSRPWTRAAAMTVAVWNPFVVERLLQGQWSLALAAWLLPAIALCPGPMQLWAMWGASLTPTGGLFALFTALFTNRRVLPFGLLACTPWLVPAVLSASSGTALASSATAFAPRAETFAGTLGSLVGLGGIWNASAVPASRSAGFAVAGIALFGVLALAWRFVPRPLLALAGIGFAIPLFSWLMPGAMGWFVENIPGAGLFRDAQKFVALALPAFVMAAARLDRIDLRLPAVALLLALVQVPDAPRAVAALAPVQVSVPAVDHQGRDVFFDGRPHLLTRPDGLPIVDPATKAMNVVESGELVVDGVRVDEPSPRWRAATDIFGTTPRPELPSDADLSVQLYYSDPQVALVVHPDGTIEDTGYPARALPRTGIALLVLWFLLPVLAFAPVLGRRLRLLR